MIDFSDQQNIALARLGDEKAFERLYRKYWKKVYHFACIYITDHDEQEDIVQQVFINLWNKRESLDENGSIDGLLFIMTRNLIFNSRRKSLNELALKELIGYNIIKAEEELPESDADELLAFARNLIDSLPRRQKEAFLLSRRYGLSYREIAAKMSISIKGVEKNISKAIKYMKSKIFMYINS